MDGTRPNMVVKNYADYTTSQSLADTIDDEPLYSATLPYSSGAFLYGTLKPASSVPITTNTPVYLAPNSIAMSITTVPPTYSMDSSAIVLTYQKTGSPLNFVFDYFRYPFLYILQSAIGNLPGMSTHALYDSSYGYGNLGTAAGTVATSSLGTHVYFNPGNPAPLIRLFFEMSNLRYAVDSTGVKFLWDQTGTPKTKNFDYTTYTTVGTMATEMNKFNGLNATGNPGYLSRYSKAFMNTTGLIAPDATLYPGLKPCTVSYDTISDRIISTRIGFDGSRIPQIDTRITYLDQTRESEIRNDLVAEQLLCTNTGDVGDLWIWVNNRFNRRQGCEAKLKQIEAIMESNQSALNLNKSLF